MPAAAAVLAIGLLAPLLAQVERRPPGLTASLAEERLQRFLESQNVWPSGNVVVPRPEIAWSVMPRAATYGVAVHRNGGPAVASAETEGTSFRLAENLAPGTYRVRIVGRDPAGEAVETREGSFTMVEATPCGEVSAARPAFHWLPVEGAARYRVRVLRADGHVVLERTETEPCTVVRPPAVIQPGDYSVAVEAHATDGHLLATRESSFRVRARLGSELRDLESEMRMTLDPAESALVLAGHYAAQGSASDVVAALESYVQARGDAASPLVLRTLTRCGVR